MNGLQTALQRLWESATRPIASITDPEDQAQARLINALLIVFTAIIGLLVLVILFTPDTADIRSSRVIVLLLIGTATCINYILLGRRGHYTAAVVVLMTVSTLIIVGGALAEGTVRVLYYLPLIFLMGSIFLSIRAALITGFVHIALLLILIVWPVSIPPDAITSGPLTYTVMLLIFTLFMARHRTRTVSYRRQMMAERDAAYRQLVDNLTDIVCTLSPAGIVLEVNHALAAASGWPVTTVTGQPFVDYIHPEDQQIFLTACETTYRHADGTYCEVRVRDANGEQRWWDMKMTTHINSQGQDLILCVARDITERKTTEAALRASETRFVTAFRANPDAININRLSDGLYIEINEGFTAIMGYTTEETIGKTSLELNIWADPADRERLVMQLEEYGEVANMEARFIDKYGYIHIGLMSARIIEIDGEPCIVSVTRDVTEQKRMETELRASEERYRMISDLISDFAFSVRVNADGGYGIEWITSEPFTAITGYPLAEVANDPQQIFHPDDVDRLNADLVKMVRVNRASQGEYRMITKNGETRWLQITRRPVFDQAAARVVSYYGAARDITPLKLAETERIKRALQTEQSSMTGRFVLAISHDFRTSLSIIETSRYLIERLIAPEQRENAQPKLERIHQAVQHMADQLDNLARASALSEPQMKPTNLYPLLNALIFKHQHMADSKGIQLCFVAEPDLPLVVCNGDDIQRAVEHMLVNALQFTDTGQIELRAAAENTHLTITVTDTGPGIAPEHVPQIFDFFFRVDPSRKVSSGGVGLGLSLVRLIARAHNGTVKVDSTPGAGSIFTLRLPRWQDIGPDSLIDMAAKSDPGDS